MFIDHKTDARPSSSQVIAHRSGAWPPLHHGPFRSSILGAVACSFFLKRTVPLMFGCASRGSSECNSRSRWRSSWNRTPSCNRGLCEEGARVRLQVACLLRKLLIRNIGADSAISWPGNRDSQPPIRPFLGRMCCSSERWGMDDPRGGAAAPANTPARERFV